MKKRIWFDLGFLLLSLSMVACDPNTASAPKEELHGTQLKKFEPKNVRLTSNRLFLWRKDLTPDKMARVLTISDEVDRLEAEAIPINERIQALNESLAPVEESIRKKAMEVNIKKNKIKKKQDELKNAPEEDKPAIEKEIATLNDQKAALESEITQLKANPGFQERDLLNEQRKEGENQLKTLLDELAVLVEFFDPAPTSIVFQFENGIPSVSIFDWKLEPNESARNFSSEAEEGRKPTILDVVYEEIGGKIRFEVVVYEDDEQTRIRETYTFKLSRSKYEANDGKVYFGGDLIRSRNMPDGTVETTPGIAKLVDKNN